MGGYRRRGVSAASRARNPFKAANYHGKWAGPYNASPLSIPTPNGLGAMHPDVLDMGAAGWQGYRYWMAFTPYDGTADTEIPCIVATNDITAGGTWVVPAGFTNPITPDPAGTAHMADTDLVYDATTDRLYVFYVTTDESSYQDVRSKWTAGDGVWSAEKVVLSGARNYVTNPSLVKTAAGWRMYYTDDLNGLDALWYRDTTSTPDSGYGAAVRAGFSLDFGAYKRKAQNINAVKDTDGSIVIVIGDGQSDGLNGTLLFARSTDGGANFTITGPPVISPGGGVSGWDLGGIYRASVMVDTTSTIVPDGNDVHLWYSGYQTVHGTWGTAHAKIPAACLRF